MYSSLFDGPEISLMEALDAKERRVHVQKELLISDPQYTLLSATMNIPGSVKTSIELEKAFKQVTDEVEICVSDVVTLVNVYRNEKTGYEYFLLVPLTKEELKKRMIKLEETHPYGRLVDLDVLWLDNGEIKNISREQLGYPKRKCFLCEKDAKVCGRSRTHSVEELHKKIHELIEEGRIQAND
ncbi:citrate lyase holo-[acyl-carrier protein] synthase [Enterococcus sp. BWB1-3]|uniref:citrate lyase holo-[acyl-carrier protein] synthase n=1 Tax=unclassified Enterococcus TaxID=2608891 RepID=UPI001920AF39|nr:MULTISPECIES: citrate lyase holo-[acyl-carrier protein] synthase [unclassified Enterococcus]MBL1230973.1 citrate lyase holo-[acyl-carrier protein] synthase [Enterococcus sp. BWB1-3]MCB5953298.1 citrate lyase holo-[acyl-carrier protein] synthase [Enterococcus sp. BWT-B8]MCB5955742.1 citrate lyase holo-[acyl-carrier protein] synthase [Enterococcus sp. CWB-B31]